MTSAAVEDLVPGQSVLIGTQLGETLEGLVLAYDAATQCLLLQQSNAPSSVAPGAARTVTLVRRAGIQRLEIINPEPTPTINGRNILEPPRFSLSFLEEKELATVRKAEEEALLLRKGVSQDAIDLFSALSKTLPASWDGSTIVVMGEILIPAPYTAQSVSGGQGPARERVRMVLTKERERLKLP